MTDVALMQNHNDKSLPVQIIKASTQLQQKVGVGEIDPKRIARAEAIIHNNAEDFSAIAYDFLFRLEQGVANARTSSMTMEEKIAGMTQPVMELKANARMFKYELVTSLANVMLGFLENIRQLDSDAIDIVAAHQTTLKAIISKRMQGDGGPAGEMFRRELEDVCQRYFKRKQQNQTSHT